MCLSKANIYRPGKRQGKTMYLSNPYPTARIKSTVKSSYYRASVRLGFKLVAIAFAKTLIKG
jgi:hypothetical protein